MKSFLIFVGGFICGVFFIFILGISSHNDSGLVIFEEEGKCFHTNSIKIFQALGSGEALGRIGQYPNDTLVLLLDDTERSFYDGEVVSVPKDKCAKQIGTYRYETKNEIMKTVPAVVIK